METWFGKDGEKALNLEGFQSFLEQLHDALEQLEFDLYDTDNDSTITGLDLARSWVAPANIKVIDTLLDRVRDVCSTAVILF